MTKSEIEWRNSALASKAHVITDSAEMKFLERVARFLEDRPYGYEGLRGVYADFQKLNSTLPEVKGADRRMRKSTP